MSIDQLDKVDFISTTQDQKVMLTISDHLPWDDKNEHLLVLQNKINAYLSFIEGGQIQDEYPSAKNKQIIINILMKYEPNDDALSFLNLCKSTIGKSGIEFSWQVINSKEDNFV